MACRATSPPRSPGSTDPQLSAACPAGSTPTCGSGPCPRFARRARSYMGAEWVGRRRRISSANRAGASGYRGQGPLLPVGTPVRPAGQLLLRAGMERSGTRQRRITASRVPRWVHLIQSSAFRRQSGRVDRTGYGRFWPKSARDGGSAWQSNLTRPLYSYRVRLN